ALQDGASGAQTQLFDVTYSYLTIPDNEQADLMWHEVNVLATGYSLDAVNIVVREHERDGSLDVDLFYAEDVFDANYSFTEALRHVLALIEAGLESWHTPVGEIDMLSDADRTHLDTFASGAPIDA
ncbi:hypothetical protein, partial [Mycobacterium sp. UM_Kg1]|uniref:hypothetical protein n=1 Tax=Mycobacterium sp. UM_Kg1 TaxID=1545691 RepID=UPI000A987A53